MKVEQNMWRMTLNKCRLCSVVGIFSYCVILKLFENDTYYLNNSCSKKRVDMRFLYFSKNSYYPRRNVGKNKLKIDVSCTWTLTFSSCNCTAAYDGRCFRAWFECKAQFYLRFHCYVYLFNFQCQITMETEFIAH